MSSKGSCVEDSGAQLMESMKDDWINVLTYQQIILLMREYQEMGFDEKPVIDCDFDGCSLYVFSLELFFHSYFAVFV